MLQQRVIELGQSKLNLLLVTILKSRISRGFCFDYFWANAMATNEASEF